MPRRAKKLEELSEILEGHVIEEFEQINVVVLKELVSEVEEISDPRDDAYVRHKLSDIILIVFFAIMANADEWEEIETFGKKKEKWLRSFLSLEHGVPTDDTYRIVISKLNANHIYRILIRFFIKKLSEILNELNSSNYKIQEEREIISLDGKVSKGSRREETGKDGQKALHTLNAYSSKWGMNIDQEFIDEKSNEIPAMPILIKRLNISGSVLTWDALNTQKETVNAVIKGKGDYVGALKGNHGNLYADVKDYFGEETLNDIRRIKNKEKLDKVYKKAVEKSHNAIITREYYIEPEIGWLHNKNEWAGLKSIGIEIKKIEKDQLNTEPIYEYRYFIASLTDVDDFSKAVRGHWGIENGLHWHLDYTFKDDNNTTTKDNGAKGLQIFKKLALSVLKIAQVIYPPRTSIKKIRYKLSLDYEKEIERIFTALSVENVKQVLTI